MPNSGVTVRNLSMTEKIEYIYTVLESIIHNEAKLFSDSRKAGIRRAQSCIQFLRSEVNNLLQGSDNKKTPGANAPG